MTAPENREFLAISHALSNEIFGSSNSIVADVSTRHQSTFIHDLDPTKPIASDYLPVSVEAGEEVSEHQLRSVLYNISGESTTQFNNLLISALRRMNTDKVKGKSKGPKRPVGKRVYETRRNTLMDDLAAIETEMTHGNPGALLTPVRGVIAIPLSGIEDVYALNLDPNEGLSKVLLAQEEFLRKALRHVASVRNAKYAVTRQYVTDPLVIPIARKPHIGDREVRIFAHQLSNALLNNPLYLMFDQPEWKQNLRFKPKM